MLRNTDAPSSVGTEEAKEKRFFLRTRSILVGAVGLALLIVVGVSTFVQHTTSVASSLRESRDLLFYQGYKTPPTEAPTDSPTGHKRFYPFKTGSIDLFPSAKHAENLVKDLGGNIDGRYKEYPGILPLDKCEILKSFADSKLQDFMANEIFIWDKNNITEDLRFEVTPLKLKDLIGIKSIEKMYNVFKDFGKDFPVSRIIIRRTCQQGNKHIQWHNDGPTQVMHAYLNGDEIDGGNLHYLTRDGTVETQARTGDGLLHSDGIVHSVSTFEGTRYILIMLSDGVESKDIVKGTILPSDHVVTSVVSSQMGQEL